MNRRMLAAAGMIAVVGGILGAIGQLSVEAAGPPTLEPYAIGTYIDEVGVRILPLRADDIASVSEANAVANALQSSGGLANADIPYSVQLTRLTDDHYGPDGGPLVIDNRLVWLVRFTGTPQPAYGPRQPKRLATELNVVIDARTGEMLEAFSYR